MQAGYFYKFGAFCFFPAKFLLVREGGIEARLQPRAAEVLQVLLENRGRMMTRKEIIAKVWGVAILVGDGNLDLQIHLLRRALDDDPANPEYIKTTKKRGVQFIASIEVVREVLAEPVTETELVASANPSPTRVLRLSRRALTVCVVVLAGLIAAATYFLSSSAAPESVNESADGSWTAIVPVLEEGVKLETRKRSFEILEGDTIEVTTVGSVDIGRGLVGPQGEEGYSDNSMDSKFKDHVGGLEMWIGPDKRANRYFIGPAFRGRVNDSGIPTFRVIESPRGYHDRDNSGSFQVTIRKVTGNQEK